MRKIALISFALLAACASDQDAAPKEVRVTQDTLSVRLTNGTLCKAPRPETGNWAGQFDTCDSPIEYRVEGVDRTNPVRILFEEFFGALGGEDLLLPEARVTLTAPDGQAWVFLSPPRVKAD